MLTALIARIDWSTIISSTRSTSNIGITVRQSREDRPDIERSLHDPSLIALSACAVGWRAGWSRRGRSWRACRPAGHPAANWLAARCQHVGTSRVQFSDDVGRQCPPPALVRNTSPEAEATSWMRFLVIAGLERLVKLARIDLFLRIGLGTSEPGAKGSAIRFGPHSAGAPEALLLASAAQACLDSALWAVSKRSHHCGSISALSAFERDSKASICALYVS